MSAKITTEFGHAVPPAPRHSVTVHIPKWSNVEKFSSDPMSLLVRLKNAYPRMKPNPDIATLSGIILSALAIEDSFCLLFSSSQSAKECVEYATSSRRDNGIDKKPVDQNAISVRRFRAKDDLYAVIFPKPGMPILGGFWTIPGVGVSSRLAEANLAHVDNLREISASEQEPARGSFDSAAHSTIKDRIIHYLNRAAVHSECSAKVKPEDIYLFPTGMAAIYRPHTYLSKSPLYFGTTVLFGMAFTNTLGVFQEFGNGFKFFGLGTDDELNALEYFLEKEALAGRKVQAIWVEFPANPILVAPNLTILRQLADRFNVVLVIDDTLGSFANVDVLYVADMLVTSLTKSFNGYADAMAGDIILNPSSKHYHNLQALFQAQYIPELYHLDAEAIELNSRDYLERTVILNRNASALVDLCHMYSTQSGNKNSGSTSSSSSIKKVHYPHPSINTVSGSNYAAFLRNSKPELTPGYGCLFSIEFQNLPSAIAFYDNLNVHNGPHLGAPSTLVFAYTMCLYGNKLDWAKQYGLEPTQIRVAVGLEDTQQLLDTFREAIEIADLAYQNSK